MTFVAGKSGNPSGRPKVNPEVMQILRDATPDAARALVSMARNPEHKHHFAACESVINRVVGMPKQPIGFADDDETSNVLAGSLAQVMALLDQSIRSGQASGNKPDGMAGSEATKPDAT